MDFNIISMIQKEEEEDRKIKEHNKLNNDLLDKLGFRNKFYLQSLKKICEYSEKCIEDMDNVMASFRRYDKYLTDIREENKALLEKKYFNLLALIFKMVNKRIIQALVIGKPVNGVVNKIEKIRPYHYNMCYNKGIIKKILSYLNLNDNDDKHHKQEVKDIGLTTNLYKLRQNLYHVDKVASQFRDGEYCFNDNYI